MTKHFTSEIDFDSETSSDNLPILPQFHQEYKLEQDRIDDMRKYPDTILIERIRIDHENLEAEILSLKAELEKHIQSDGFIEKNKDTTTLLNRYKNKINEYHEIFLQEQHELDEIKKIRREVADFQKLSRDDLKVIETKINGTEDPDGKKFLRSVVRKLKSHVKDLKNIENKLHDITLKKTEAIELGDEKKRLETNYKSLHIPEIQNAMPEKLLEQKERFVQARKKRKTA